MTLTAEQKEQNRFDRMLAKAKELFPHNYLRRFVAPSFQKMIRAEAGAREGLEAVVKQGTIQHVNAPIGYCACVTCGKVLPWSVDTKSGQEGMDTGHCIAGRAASIVLEESNVAPQCQFCNKHQHGMPEAYERWFVRVRGKAELDRLKQLRDQTVRKFTHEELVALRIQYMDRLKAAVQQIEQNA